MDYPNLMRTHAITVAVTLLAPVFATLYACGGGDPEAQRAVQDTFGAYVEAVSARDGDAAAALIGPATVAYYEELATLALTADREALSQRRLLDRLGALAVRASLPAETVEELDGRALYARAVSDGFVAGDARRLTVEGVDVDGDKARAVMALDGQALPVKLTAVRRGERWLVEPSSLMPALDESLRSIPKQLGLDEEPWVLDAVGSVLGRPVDASLWTPPRPTPR